MYTPEIYSSLPISYPGVTIDPPRRAAPKRAEPSRAETRRDETRRDETRRDETRRDETRCDETRRDEMIRAEDPYRYVMHHSTRARGDDRVSLVENARALAPNDFLSCYLRRLLPHLDRYTMRPHSNARSRNGFLEPAARGNTGTNRMPWARSIARANFNDRQGPRDRAVVSLLIGAKYDGRSCKRSYRKHQK